MSSDKIFEIPIPSDNDRFVVLKCPICSEKFMIQVQDVNDDSFIDVWCPKCGLKSDNYLDDDVNDLAENIIQNYVADLLNDFSKDMERTFRNNKNIQFKGSKKIARESEMPIGRKVGDFEEKKYLCCDKVVKLRTTTKFEGGYCPFCGELVDGD